MGRYVAHVIQIAGAERSSDLCSTASVSTARSFTHHLTTCPFDICGCCWDTDVNQRLVCTVVRIPYLSLVDSVPSLPSVVLPTTHTHTHRSGSVHPAAFVSSHFTPSSIVTPLIQTGKLSSRPLRELF